VIRLAFALFVLDHLDQMDAIEATLDAVIAEPSSEPPAA
jgi:hypothetical protein